MTACSSGSGSCGYLCSCCVVLRPSCYSCLTRTVHVLSCGWVWTRPCCVPSAPSPRPSISALEGDVLQLSPKDGYASHRRSIPSGVPFAKSEERWKAVGGDGDGDGDGDGEEHKDGRVLVLEPSKADSVVRKRVKSYVRHGWAVSRHAHALSFPVGWRWCMLCV